MKKILYLFVVLLFATTTFAQDNEVPYPLWTDTIVSQPEGYRMDAEGNVEISSSDGLVWLISTVNGLNGCDPDNFEGRTVRLTNDIDFGEEGWNYCFSPIGKRETPFLGTFDGDGHKIHHLCQKYSRFDGVNNYFFDMGVFGYIRHATVKNVTLDSTCQIASSCTYYGCYRGGMVGFSDSLSVVDNIFIHSREISFYYGSCLVGMNRNSTVRNCACGGHDYDCAPYEGAVLVAYNLCDGDYADAVVENCYFYGGAGKESFTFNLGGLVYFNETLPNSNGKQAVLRNCHSTPTRDFYSIHNYGTYAAFLSEGSSISYCYTDFSKTSFKHMIGLNEGGEFRDCSEYTNIDRVGTLAVPITINDTATDNLIDALNLWIANQEHPELYRTWTIINDSIPVFGDYYVGVPENQDSNDWVTVHPNPTSGFVSVKGENLRQAKVFNMLGEKVFSVQGKDNELQIDMSSLPTGVYFVIVTNEDGQKSVHKVVKE
ncbi:MAG: T9SS type A sorting domain-containing protein [Bacteroidales bacterium]|nr:T9SS type A sorting domain-containing protein [Bacteroidales bacterium]